MKFIDINLKYMYNLLLIVGIIYKVNFLYFDFD